MSSNRSTFLAGTIFGIVIGLPIGHLTLWSTSNSQNTEPKVARQTPDSSIEMPFELGPTSTFSPFYPDEPVGVARLAPQEPIEVIPEPEITITPNSPLANAIAIRTVEMDPVEGQQAPTAADLQFAVEEPEPLQLPDAIPLNTDSETKAANLEAGDQRLRAIIDQEIPDVPAPQREIWFESLREMNAEDATGVLRMWKMIGGPIPGIQDSPFGETVPTPPSIESPPAEKDTAPDEIDRIIESAVLLHEQNSLMSSTLGYRRIVPRFVEEIRDGQSVVTGIIPEFDFTSGATLISGNPLDLRIDGPGMFLVEDADGNQFLTRRGRFTINKDRRVALIDPDGIYLLKPTIELPEDFEQVSIHWDGRVSVAESNKATFTEVGSIHLCPIFQPHLLLYHKNGLLKLKDGAAPLRSTLPGGDGVGRLQQGTVEVSNVLPAKEIEQIQRLRNEQSLRQRQTASEPTDSTKK